MFDGGDVPFSRRQFLLAAFEVAFPEGQRAFTLPQVLLPIGEFLGPDLHLRPLDVEAVCESLGVVAGDRDQFVEHEQGDALTHADADRLSVSLPHHLGGTGDGDLGHPLTLLLVELGAEDIVDLAEDLTA